MEDNKQPRSGRFLTKKKIETFTQKSPVGERKGEFFSKTLLEQLLSVENCEGLLVYYGQANEDDNHKIIDSDGPNLQPRLFLVPVKTKTVKDNLRLDSELAFYLRVDGAGKDVDEEFGGAGDGIPHPPFGS